MNKKEKEAIEYLKTRLHGNEGCKYIDVSQEDLRIFINLVDRKEKDIEGWKKYCEEIKKKVKEIQKEKQLKWNFKRASNEKQLIKELDDIILEKFNLEDNNFIDYILNVQIPIIKNKKDIILKEVKINDLKKYSQVFIKYFSQIFNKENKFIKVIIYPKIVNRFSIFELVICDKKPNIDIEIKENVDYNKEIMTKFSIQKYTDMFYQIKDVVNFEENSFYIIKTNEYKNWHPAMANIDLDTIIEELLSENGGDC